jgi:hypothetical protein
LRDDPERCIVRAEGPMVDPAVRQTQCPAPKPRPRQMVQSQLKRAWLRRGYFLLFVTDMVINNPRRENGA